MPSGLFPASSKHKFQTCHLFCCLAQQRFHRLHFFLERAKIALSIDSYKHSLSPLHVLQAAALPATIHNPQGQVIAQRQSSNISPISILTPHNQPSPNALTLQSYDAATTTLSHSTQIYTSSVQVTTDHSVTKSYSMTTKIEETAVASNAAMPPMVCVDSMHSTTASTFSTVNSFHPYSSVPVHSQQPPGMNRSSHSLGSTTVVQVRAAHRRHRHTNKH